MRAAIYARYSSDLQSPTSIADQVRLCRDRAAAIGAEVVEVYSDAAISGSSTINRPGLQKLMSDAKAGGAFDLLILEALDRLSRDLEDVAATFKRLRHADVAIVTVAEGEISELHIGFKGTMNALFLKDLAQKIRRGQKGRAIAGKNTGGRAYGYRIVRRLDAAGELVRGDRTIDPAEAEIVRRIFAEYGAGRSARAIAAGLNADGIAGPRGGPWNASTIGGSRARRNGILWNELYVGRTTYNRQSFRKDPETGRRVSRVNASGDWTAAEAPDLRIITDEAWRQAQAIKAEISAKPRHLRQRPRRLLSGLVRCGACGGPFSSNNSARMGCSRRKEGGRCDNPRTIRTDDLERRVVAGLRDQLLTPERLAEFVEDYRAGAKRRRSAAAGARVQLEREIREIDAKVKRIVEAIADGTDSPAMRGHLAGLESRRQAAAAEVAIAAEPVVVDLLPNLAEVYRRQLDELQSALESDPTRKARAMTLLRALVEAVVVTPEEGRGESRVELHGRLAALLAASREQGKAGPRPAPRVRSLVVAVDGFEPPTKGL